MTDAPRDGGPAFAAVAENRLQTGMSLRDYFAAHAPITTADAMRQLESQGAKEYNGVQLMKMLAQMRGAYADSMLEERKP